MISSSHASAARLLPGIRLCALALCIATSACVANDDTQSVVVSSEDQAAAAETVAPEFRTTASVIDPADAEPRAGAGSSPHPSPTTGIWHYNPRTSASGATVPRASITSRSGQETLVFEHHPVSGRDAILELAAAPGCKTGCKVSWSVDGGPFNEVPASHQPSEPTWLSVRQPRELWKALLGARVLDVSYQGARGPAQASFDVTGADATKLPGWDR